MGRRAGAAPTELPRQLILCVIIRNNPSNRTILSPLPVCDTVRFRMIGSELRQDYHLPIEESVIKLPQEGVMHSLAAPRIRLITGNRKVRITGNQESGFIVEGSLPNFVHGTNGKLLKTAAELTDAWLQLQEWLSTIFTPPKSIEFLRVDLCWQFVGDIKLFIASHRSIRHPQIRGLPFIKPDESLWYGSGNGSLRIRMYDKTREMTGKAGNIVRVEVVMRKKKLRMELNGNLSPVTSLDFGACYQAYRRILLQFNPLPCLLQAEPRRSLASFLASGDMAGWELNGQRA